MLERVFFVFGASWSMFWSMFWSMLQDAPNCPNNAPTCSKTLQDAPRIVPRRSKNSSKTFQTQLQDAPKIVQDAPKIIAKHAPKRSKAVFGTIKSSSVRICLNHKRQYKPISDNKNQSVQSIPTINHNSNNQR